VIVEAGAHVGVDTVEMARLWPQAMIHAFEPVSSLFEQMKVNAAPFSNIRCYREGLSENGGFQKIFVSSGASDGSSSLLPPREHLTEHPEVRFEEEMEVETVTLDGWQKREGIEKIDFLWLDLQGMEPAVLKKSPKAMEGVSVIHTEVSLKEVYDGGELYPEFRRWLEDQGFIVKMEQLPWADMGNVLLIRPRKRVM
jgi:FkbM family methyltransferase